MLLKDNVIIFRNVTGRKHAFLVCLKIFIRDDATGTRLNTRTPCKIHVAANSDTDTDHIKRKFAIHARKHSPRFFLVCGKKRYRFIITSERHMILIKRPSQQAVPNFVKRITKYPDIPTYKGNRHLMKRERLQKLQRDKPAADHDRAGSGLYITKNGIGILKRLHTVHHAKLPPVNNPRQRRASHCQ